MLLKEGNDWCKYYEYLSDYDAAEVLVMLKNKQNLWTPLINPSMYQQALNEFTKFGHFEKFPTKYIYQWMGIIMKNTAIIRSISELAGHDMYFPYDAIKDVFFEGDDEKWEEYKKSLEHKGISFSPDFGWTEDFDGLDTGEIDDGEAGNQYLEDNGYFDMMTLPDGSDAWSDYGIQPLESIICQYEDELPPEKVIVLINKALDVAHPTGDLSSAFIVGGKSTLSQISNSGYINESVKEYKRKMGQNNNDLNTICKELKPYMDSLWKYMASHGYTTKHRPKVILDNTKQEGVFVYTGYFDPEAKGIRLFVNGRGYKDILRTLAHELIHRKQDEDGVIAKSGYKGDQITEDKNLVKLEAEAYLKGNMAFRSWTEEEKKKGILK